jgi:hypothetical protein
MMGVGQREGGPCGKSDWSQGGGEGFNGCGCNVVYAEDSTLNLAVWHVNTEGWAAVVSDSNDAAKGAYYGVRYFCNYNVNAYSWDN